MDRKPYIHFLTSFDAGANKGILTFAEELKDIPFKFSRFFFTYNVGEGFSRGGHAHKSIFQALIAISGNFTVSCESIDGEISTFHLNKPDMCLIIPPLFWSIQLDFSIDAVCFVVSDGLYDENEYIRDKLVFNYLK
jgi:hypothetical protein